MPSTTPVSEIMTRDVVTLRSEDTFERAADVLAEHQIGAAPVLDGSGKLVGLLRDEDLIVSEANLHAPTWFNFLGAEFPMPGQNKRFEEELKRMVAASVADLMVREFPTCLPTDTVGMIATQMHDADVTHMPVVDDEGGIVGIVARGDIVRHLAMTT